VLSHWFLKYRGQYTGLATSGGAIGGLIFPLMLRHTLKIYGYAWAMRIWGFTCLGFMIISTSLIRTRFKREVNLDDTVASKWKKFTGKFSKNSFKKFHDRTFCYLVLAAFFTELALVLLLTYFPTYCIANGVSESTSYIMITVWNAFGIGGRWIPGILSDKLGMFNTNFVILTLFSLSILVILLPFGHAINVMYAFAACGGFFSGIISFLPALVSQISSVQEVGERYSTINCFLSLANLFGVPIASAIINRGTVHDYDMFVIFVGILATLGTGFYLVTRWMLVGYRLNIKV
jgi:MFS family permease